MRRAAIRTGNAKVKKNIRHDIRSYVKGADVHNTTFTIMSTRVSHGSISSGKHMVSTLLVLWHSS